MFKNCPVRHRWVTKRRQIKQLTWFVAELTYSIQLQEDIISANSEAIEAVVTELKDAAASISAKVDALSAAVAAGEDLSQPLADLKAAADAVQAIAPPAV